MPTPRAQLNIRIADRLLDEMTAAIHLTSTLDQGPHDQGTLTTNAIRRELDRLADELRDGEPWDVELGARLRTARRRRRT